MSKKKKYTIDQITDAWEAYSTKRCFRYLKGGHTYIHHQKPDASDTSEPITKLENVKYSQVMGFPQFLRTING